MRFTVQHTILTPEGELEVYPKHEGSREARLFWLAARIIRRRFQRMARQPVFLVRMSYGYLLITSDDERVRLRRI